MGILESIILGIVQGLTEFLPVSSSGHLVLLQNIFGMSEPQLFFDVMLHVGTLVAVVVVLWKDIVEIFKNILGKKTWLLVVATVPAVVATILFKDFFESTFGGKYLGFEFIVTGILLTVAESVYEHVSMRKYNDINYIDAIIMGVGQAFAIFPAVSRSGATIAAGLMRGMERKTVAKFAFLMSIPGILGACVLEGVDAVKGGLSNVDWIGTGLGVIFAFAAGFIAVKFMISFVSQKKLYGFAIYTLVLGALVILDQFVFNIFFKIRPF
jgi:undecaprenyl-diphosphatase